MVNLFCIKKTIEIEVYPPRTCLAQIPHFWANCLLNIFCPVLLLLKVSRRLRQDGARLVWSKLFWSEDLCFLSVLSSFYVFETYCQNSYQNSPDPLYLYLTVWTSLWAQSRFIPSLCKMFLWCLGKGRDLSGSGFQWVLWIFLLSAEVSLLLYFENKKWEALRDHLIVI